MKRNKRNTDMNKTIEIDGLARQINNLKWMHEENLLNYDQYSGGLLALRYLVGEEMYKAALKLAKKLNR